MFSARLLFSPIKLGRATDPAHLSEHGHVCEDLEPLLGEKRRQRVACPIVVEGPNARMGPQPDGSPYSVALMSQLNSLAFVTKGSSLTKSPRLRRVKYSRDRGSRTLPRGRDRAVAMAHCPATAAVV
jgi:hypothetical protein